MSFLRRKQPGDAVPVGSTATSGDAPPAPRFQRRGARGQPAQSAAPVPSQPAVVPADVPATDPVSTQSSAAVAVADPVPQEQKTSETPTGQPTTSATDAASTTTSSVPAETAPLLDPQAEAAILQLQQDRLDELAAAREDRYAEALDPATFESVHDYEIWAIKRYLWLWERALASRSQAEAQGYLGKRDLLDYNEARTDLRPLIKQIRNRKVKNEILLCVANVLDALKKRDYIQAEQAFMDVAIGNNPWPVGLPKVGIHERRAREKIDPSLVDHLLKDPTIQAYMRALKRLMVWVQHQFPPQ